MHRKTWYWLFKNVLIGPFLRIWNRPKTAGLDNVPATGGAIAVSNHLSVFDSFYLPLLVTRRITFLAKKEYFTSPGLIGRFQAWFFTVLGQVPVDRNDPDAAQLAIEAATRLVNDGEIVAIYPEGTRSPDGRLYKGKTGAARVAIATGAPLVPVAMFGTRKANPVGSWILRPVTVGMTIGEPIDPVQFLHGEGLPVDPDSYESARALTDECSRRLAAISGQEFVDAYAADVKKSLAAGNGYPPGTEPRHS
ncbi:lysophospholipid acyltransferase family protein [Corynebacterium mendelii]|uniref:1-acyl-sn-glycerol-3-phosphate acyltransferase n=1 Tax=Corynebacterium mendelii TaxID=2765362 RepID=A0A939DXL0_9CORY|nr:lysophospholipid acyltransferase family protein [Corynebacterium mendelii]MBN9643075.1 1-acyl-sn-glycerol-3-phosphate acyltransferase [Corynebacterium mendelii]